MKIKQFRIYPEKKNGVWFKAFLFPDKESMYAFERIIRERVKSTASARQQTDYVGYRFEALTTAYVKPEKNKQLGYLLFHQGFLGAGVVSHEITHAAFRYWDYKKRKFSSLKNGLHTKQEDFCMMVERMNMYFWAGYYR